jgi:hypothetical protein
MKLTININCDNDTFQNADASLVGELKLIIDPALMNLQVELDSMVYPVGFKLFDSNGNAVGELKLTE